MGKASTTAKNKLKLKKYDRIEIVVPKGEKELIEKHAKTNFPSTNSYIYQLIKNDMKGNSNQNE